MALPTSGTITLAQIRAEFGGPYSLGSFYRGGSYTTANNLSVPTSGQISFSQFYGAVKSVPGSRSYGVGTYYLAIPPYSWITFDVRAAGGGGGSVGSGYSGGAGGGAQVSGGNISVYANGGAGGTYGVAGGTNYYPSGTPRAADGWGNQGAGGGAGGGSGTQSSAYGTIKGQNGGYGGRSVITYSAGQLVVGATMTIYVGGGGGGAPSNGLSTAGTAGGGGAVYISWG